MRYHDITDGIRPWRRYNRRSTGTCVLSAGNDFVEAAFSLGEVATGRQQVFVGVFITIVDPSGARFIGEDEYSFLRALRAVVVKCARGGWALEAVGLHDQFTQSGLIDGTAWGYHPDVQGQVHILTPPHTLPCPPPIKQTLK